MIAIATSQQYPDLYPPDQWMINAFEVAGYKAIPVVWDDSSVDWKDFDIVVIRSTWDYYVKVDAWKRWLDTLEQLGIRLINDVSIVMANMDKAYLKELNSKGIKIVESIFIDKASSVEAAFNTVIWDEMIIKPTISAGSHLTERFSKSELPEIIEKYTEIGKETDLILQPFLSEIITNGEISLVYFDNTFSHSIIKRPVEGDFRIQLQFGGQYSAYQASTELIEFGYEALNALANNAVYGRVDCILINGFPHIMEVELIEPDLYFDFHVEAKDRYFKAVMSRVGEI